MRFRAPEPQPTELEVLYQMVDAFARDMKGRLKQAYDDNKRGWSDEGWTEREIIDTIALKVTGLVDASFPKQPILDCLDLANYAMFLWNKRYPSG